MPTPLDFEAILARRDEVFRQLASLGDLRPGSLVARFRKCGKPNCHCAAEGAPRTRPQLVAHSRGARQDGDAGDPCRCRRRDVRSDRRVPSLAPADRGTDRGQRAIM